MRKSLMILLVFILLALSACVGAEKAAVDITPESVPTDVVDENTPEAPGTTPQSEEGAPEVADSLQESAGIPVSECTLVSSMPDSPQEYAELFAVTDDDWVIGPEDAAITLVEYGDFQ